ncbi:iron chelate uptake ABC transporter family permease subunit, partial [Streptococcus agalactiae]
SYTVGELRLPRAALAVVAGACFGAAGTTFQTLLRNQLASPDVIGISAGASAAGVVAILFFDLSAMAVSAWALLGGLA